jgi:rod shape-determining protein MreC
MAGLFARYQKLTLPLGLWLFSLGLLSVQSWQKGRSHPSPFSRAVAEVMSFPQRCYGYAAEGMARTWNNYVYLVRIREQNVSLQKQLAFLEMENQILREQAGEAERLRALLNFQKTIDLVSIPARIIGWDLSSYAQTMTINRGKEDGIIARQTAIAFQGLVGQVLDEPGRVMTRNSSVVLLITDPTSRVSVIVERTRDRGILEGMGRDDRMLLVYLPAEAALEKGDVVSTSGLGGVFPPGIKVGTVVKVESNPLFGSVQCEVKPSVDFAHLEQVLILTGPKGQALDNNQAGTEKADVKHKD